MTEEEYDLKNIKLAKRRKYALLISILISVLTSFYVVPLVGSFIFLIILLGSLFSGLSFASSFIGLRLTSQTPLQWIFSFAFPLTVTITWIFSDHLTDKLFEEDEDRLFRSFILAINSISFAQSIGFGIFVSFNSEIERIAKLIRFSKPQRENILKIESSEINSN